MSRTIAPPVDQFSDTLDVPDIDLSDLLAVPRTPRAPRPRWSPGRMDVPEDENGECLFCHGSPGPAGCEECGAVGR